MFFLFKALHRNTLIHRSYRRHIRPLRASADGMSAELQQLIPNFSAPGRDSGGLGDGGSEAIGTDKFGPACCLTTDQRMHDVGSAFGREQEGVEARCVDEGGAVGVAGHAPACGACARDSMPCHRFQAASCTKKSSLCKGSHCVRHPSQCLPALASQGTPRASRSACSARW